MQHSATVAVCGFCFAVVWTENIVPFDGESPCLETALWLRGDLAQQVPAVSSGAHPRMPHQWRWAGICFCNCCSCCGLLCTCTEWWCWHLLCFGELSVTPNMDRVVWEEYWGGLASRSYNDFSRDAICSRSLAERKRALYDLVELTLSWTNTRLFQDG